MPVAVQVHRRAALQAAVAADSRPARRAAQPRDRQGRFFGYDAAKGTNKRRKAVVSQKSEDDELPYADRLTLISLGRDLQRNYSLAAWAIRKHLDYVATFAFQSRTGDRALDKRIEDLVAWWSRRQNCDVAGRHPLRRLVRIAEARATIEGDIVLVKLADGRVQAVEADRIKNPNLLPNTLPSGARLVQGVAVDKAGAALAYYVCRRWTNYHWYLAANYGLAELEAVVDAQNAIHHGYFDRIDQIRGSTPLSSALNSYRDTYEGLDLALAKAKVSQLFGIKFKRDDAAQLPQAESPAEETDADTSRYPIDFGKGPYLLDLDPGDDAEVMESHTPSSEFQAFMQTIIAIALKSLDIPFSFYDESFTTYSGARQAWIQYEQSAQNKRADLRDVLDTLTAWKLGQWIAAGLITLPSGLTLPMLRWDWISQGVPWIDPLKEVQADVVAVNNALTSRTRILREQGQDWGDVLDELDAENQALRDRGIAIPGFAPIPIPADAQAAKNQRP